MSTEADQEENCRLQLKLIAARRRLTCALARARHAELAVAKAYEGMDAARAALAEHAAR